MDKYVAPSEIAQRLAVGVDVVQDWCRTGAIQASFLPGIDDFRISERALEVFLQATRVLPPSDGPYLPANETVQVLIDRLLRGIAPEKPIMVAGEGALRVFIHRPTVQRLEAEWWQENDQWLICLRYWPADNVSQARKFFEQIDIEAFLALLSQGWDIRPCPHLSFAQTHLVYQFKSIALEPYIRFWKATQAAIRQYGRTEGGADFGALRAILAQIHELSAKGQEEFQQGFMDTARESANLIPGLAMQYIFPYREALQLEGEGLLVRKQRDRINAAMATWGESLS